MCIHALFNTVICWIARISSPTYRGGALLFKSPTACHPYKHSPLLAASPPSQGTQALPPAALARWCTPAPRKVVCRVRASHAVHKWWKTIRESHNRTSGKSHWSEKDSKSAACAHKSYVKIFSNCYRVFDVRTITTLSLIKKKCTVIAEPEGEATNLDV